MQMSDTITPTELDTLIEDCLEGRLAEVDAARLSTHLEQSAEARARYWEAASVHGLLENFLQDASLRAVTGQAISPASRTPRWQQWRPLTAAALGLFVGLGSASLVFGFVAQRNAIKKVPVALFASSFEDSSMTLGSGFPTDAGRWSGDAAQVVSAENGIAAKEGKLMLRLEPATKPAPRIFQVLDLQSLPSDKRTGMREIEVSASFAAADPEAAVRYMMRAFAVTDTPDMLGSSWFDRRDESIASVTRGFDVLPGTTGWQTFSIRLQVPTAARSLVLFFGARTPDKNARTSPHYLDDVCVSLLLP